MKEIGKKITVIFNHSIVIRKYYYTFANDKNKIQ